MASINGTIKKLEFGGRTWSVGADTEAQMTLGGDYISEGTQTNQGINISTKPVSGKISGLAIIASSANGDITELESIAQESISSPVSSLIQMADGSKYTAAVHVQIENVDEGHFNTGTGEVTITLMSAGANGKFQKLG